MKKGILVIIVIVSLITPVCWAQDWLTWVEHPDNPVLDPVSRAYYPCVIFDVEMFDSAGVSAPYKVWYQSESGIVHGYSFDGVDWFDAGVATGLVSTAAHPWVLYDEDGFGGGVYYKIWYWTGMVTPRFCSLHRGSGMGNTLHGVHCWSYHGGVTGSGTVAESRIATME